MKRSLITICSMFEEPCSPEEQQGKSEKNLPIAQQQGTVVIRLNEDVLSSPRTPSSPFSHRKGSRGSLGNLNYSSSSRSPSRRRFSVDDRKPCNKKCVVWFVMIVIFILGCVIAYFFTPIKYARYIGFGFLACVVLLLGSCCIYTHVCITCCHKE